MRPLMGRQVAGVCIGLSQAYGWDLSLIRVLAVLGLLFSGGMVAIAYIACWVGIPEEPLPMPGGIPGSAPGPYPPASA